MTVDGFLVRRAMAARSRGGIRGVLAGRSHWSLVNGIPVHARAFLEEAARDAPAIVLVHGVGVSGRYLVPTATHLSPHCKVWVPDLGGFGPSLAPDAIADTAAFAGGLAAWLDEVGLRRPTFFGNSYGCQILAEFAAHHPERVDRLVLQGPTVDPEARSWSRQIPRWLRNSPNEPPGMFPIMVRDYRDARLGRVIKTFSHALRHEMEWILPRVVAPTLVVRGKHDPIAPARWARECARLLPEGSLREIDGAHTLNFSHPAEVARAVLDFLQERENAQSQGITAAEGERS